MVEFLTDCWWRFDPEDVSAFDAVYSWFNVVEGVIWWLLAGFVGARFARNRKSLLEPVYAGLFVTFG